MLRLTVFLCVLSVISCLPTGRCYARVSDFVGDWRATLPQVGDFRMKIVDVGGYAKVSTKSTLMAPYKNMGSQYGFYYTADGAHFEDKNVCKIIVDVDNKAHHRTLVITVKSAAAKVLRAEDFLTIKTGPNKGSTYVDYHLEVDPYNCKLEEKFLEVDQAGMKVRNEGSEYILQAGPRLQYSYRRYYDANAVLLVLKNMKVTRCGYVGTPPRPGLAYPRRPAGNSNLPVRDATVIRFDSKKCSLRRVGTRWDVLTADKTILCSFSNEFDAVIALRTIKEHKFGARYRIGTDKDEHPFDFYQ